MVNARLFGRRSQLPFDSFVINPLSIHRISLISLYVLEMACARLSLLIAYYSQAHSASLSGLYIIVFYSSLQRGMHQWLLPSLVGIFVLYSVPK